jgi:hypothetical protein
MIEEIYKDIPEYEGLYQVSNLGNVKSLNYKRSKKEIALIKSSGVSNYDTVVLRKNNKSKTRYVHHLVAIVFLNHIPNGYKIVINHKNFIRKDNRVENLEIITQRENANQKHLSSSSKYLGVHFCNTIKKYRSQITINGKQKFLGNFECEIDASNTYNNALKQLL